MESSSSLLRVCAQEKIKSRDKSKEKWFKQRVFNKKNIFLKKRWALFLYRPFLEILRTPYKGPEYLLIVRP